MKKEQKKIITNVDELACFVADTIVCTHSILGRELTGPQMREIYTRLINDISVLDLKAHRKEFLELLEVYEFSHQSIAEKSM